MENLSEETLQKIAELETQIEEMKGDMTPHFTELGKNYYEMQEGYEERIASVREKLDEKKERIENLKIEILALKGIVICPNCGCEVSDEVMFCGECGTKIRTVEAADDEHIVCSRCGALNDKDMRFCTSCGQKLEVSKVDESIADAKESESENNSENPLTVAVAEEVAVAEKASDVPESSEEPEFKFCPNCGVKLPGYAMFCAECGERI